jgi:hypothetical protein
MSCRRAHFAPPPRFFLLLGAFAKLRRATFGFVIHLILSIRPMEQLCSHWTHFREVSYVFWKIFRENVSFLRSDKNDYMKIFVLTIIARLILLSMRNVKEKSCRENQTYVLCLIPPPPENRAVYETMWKNAAESGRPQKTIWRMRFACCIIKATSRQSEYVIVCAFPLKQWLGELASLLRLYVQCFCYSLLRQRELW